MTTDCISKTIKSTAEKIAAYRGRVADVQLDALVLGAALALWSDHCCDGVQPFDVEDAIRAELASL